MGRYIQRKSIVDPETGELLQEKSWLNYDGFSEDGYRYRSNATFIRYYFDSLPANYDEHTLLLLFMLAEIMTDENVLLYRVKRKSKFSTIIYKPYSKEEIKDLIRFEWGINKFTKAWNELKKCAIKRIKYRDIWVWAVNPAIVSKCKYVPYWLYEEFQMEMNPYLSKVTLQKLQNKLSQFEK